MGSSYGWLSVSGRASARASRPRTRDPRHRSAESITGSKSMACVSRLVDDDDLAGPVLVAAATEHIASELEGAGAVGDDADAPHLARLEVGADTELGNLEAVVPVQRGDFQDDRDALLERDLVRGVLELLRGHVHDLLRPRRHGGRREAMPAGGHPGRKNHESSDLDDALHRSALLDCPLGERVVIARVLRLD